MWWNSKKNWSLLSANDWVRVIGTLILFGSLLNIITGRP